MLKISNPRPTSLVAFLLCAASLAPFTFANDLIDAAKIDDTARAEALIKQRCGSYGNRAGWVHGIALGRFK